MLCLKSSWHKTVFHLVWANFGLYLESKTYLYRNSNHTHQDQIADEYLESFCSEWIEFVYFGTFLSVEILEHAAHLFQIVWE